MALATKLLRKPTKIKFGSYEVACGYATVGVRSLFDNAQRFRVGLNPLESNPSEAMIVRTRKRSSFFKFKSVQVQFELIRIARYELAKQ